LFIYQESLNDARSTKYKITIYVLILLSNPKILVAAHGTVPAKRLYVSNHEQSSPSCCTLS